jgi:hypothetical protein
MDDSLRISLADNKVSVPVDKKALGEFISGLLGQPQSLERVIDSAFSVNHSWLVHLCSLILQRMNQQNAPEPLAFVADIGYEGGVRRKVTSFPAFEHFSETQNIISKSVKINIAVLIQFPGKIAPERQEIVIDFDVQDSRASIMESLIIKQSAAGKIRVEIRHTERTWADDVLRLITDELENIQVKESRLKKRLRNAIFPFATFVFPITMIAAMSFDLFLGRNKGNTNSQSAQLLIADKGETLSVFNAKLNLLLTQLIDGNETKRGFPIVIGSTVLIAIVLFLGGALLARPMPSFVVLSRAAEKHEADTMRRLKNKTWLLLLSMCGSVVLGVVGNYIYDKMK